MSYIPHTEQERQQMLAAIGAQHIDDLYEDVPESVRFPDLDLPEPATEMEIRAELQALSEANLQTREVACFLGAGAYDHYIPSVVDHILRRSEFYTAYTPYQPEVSQGTLQAIFEYQSLMVNLTGMEVSNASHYDGATALAEAVILALNQHRGKRTKVLLSAGIHPHYRQVVRTYLMQQELEFSGDESVENDADALEGMLDENTALVAVQYPDFFGTVRDFSKLAAAAHEVGALVCFVVNPLTLGILKPPSEYGADVVVGDGQPLGIPMSFGGPTVGIFTTLDKYVRKMAGRLVGETVDSRGQRGFVLTLTPREQHIRRDKATSNICTNQGLMALATAVYLSQLGKSGLAEVAQLCYQKAHYAAEQIGALSNYSFATDAPFFHEFAVRCPMAVSQINERLLEYDIIGGYELGNDYPEMENTMLIAVTELNSKEEIDDLVHALGEVADD